MRALRVLAVICAAAAMGQPLADHHQHLFHPSDTGLAPDTGTVTAAGLVRYLDEAGIRKALVLSVAYQFGNPNRPPVADEYARVRAENDWTSQQVALYPGRLRGFCGVNPLRDYAVEELARCARDPRLRSGIKLHFGNSDVDLDNIEHVRRLRQVFREANRRRMAIVVHMRSSVTRQRPYGAKQARVFLGELLPEAPRIPVQIAHLCSAGDYGDPAVDDALGVFADAAGKGDPRMKRVYFDISMSGNLKQTGERIAARVRQIGLRRILFGSDGAVRGNSPREYWAKFRQLPFSEAEFRRIERNAAPYLR